jgi:glutaconyl-CoA decarboxylase
MRHFHVTVNGQSYQVSVEETAGAFAPVQPAFVPAAAPVAAPAPVQAPVAAAPAPQAAPAPAPVASSSAPVDGEKIYAPMPGTIVDVKAAVGTQVKKGDVVLILEAMKMENELLAPVDGVIRQILVSQGASVNSGDVLVVVG